MRTLAALGFIAAAAVVALVLAVRPTIADGRVVAADLLAELRDHGVAAIVCDDKIPIGRDGAVFGCTATLDDGQTRQVEYTMDRTGELRAKLMSATETPHRIPASADPWGNRP